MVTAEDKLGVVAVKQGIDVQLFRVKLEKPDTTGWLYFIDSGDRDQRVEVLDWLAHQLFPEDSIKHNQLGTGFYPVLRT